MEDIILVISLAPAIFLLYIFYQRDKLKPEPTNVISRIFILGGLFSALIAGVINTFLTKLFFGSVEIQKINFNTFWDALKFGAIPGFVEEILKFIAILIFVYKIKEFDERTDGIIYALCIGMGFAAIENLSYVFKFGPAIAFLRALTAVPFHAILAVIMGYFIGRAKFSSKKKFLFFLEAIFIPIIFHTLYDTIVSYFSGNDLFELILVLSIIIFAIIGIVFSLKLTEESSREDFRFFSLKKLEVLSKLSIRGQKEIQEKKNQALFRLREKARIEREKDLNFKP